MTLQSQPDNVTAPAVPDEITEERAYHAFQRLESDAPETGDADVFREYSRIRKAKGEALFPEMAAKTARRDAEALRTLFGGEEKALTLASGPKLKAALDTAQDREELLAETAITNYAAKLYNKPVEQIRDAWQDYQPAMAMAFGGRADMDSKALYKAIGAKLEAAAEKEKAAEAVSELAMESALRGRHWFQGWNEAKDAIEGIGMEEEDRGQLLEVWRQSHNRARKAYGNMPPKLSAAFQYLAKRSGANVTMDSNPDVPRFENDGEFSRWVGKLPEDEFKTMLFGLSVASKYAGHQYRGFWNQAGTALANGSRNYLASLREYREIDLHDWLQRIDEGRMNWGKGISTRAIASTQPHEMQDLSLWEVKGEEVLITGRSYPLLAPNERGMATYRQWIVDTLKQQERAGILRQQDNVVAPLIPGSWLYSPLEKGLYDAATSVPLTAAAFVPYVGMQANAKYMAKQNAAKLAIDYPALDPVTRTQVAETAGLLQAMEETVFTKLAFGRFKGVQSFFAKAGAGKPLVRFGLNLAVGTTSEFIEEKAQDATLPVVQTFLSALKEDAPAVDWDKEWNEVCGGNKDLFFAILPLAMVGAGAATHGDIQQYRQITGYARLLEAAKLPPEAIKAIIGEADLSKRDELIRKAFRDRDAQFMRDSGFTEETAARVGGIEEESQRLASMDEAFALEGAAQAEMAGSQQGVDVLDDMDGHPTVAQRANPGADAINAEMEFWEDFQRRGLMPSITPTEEGYRVDAPDDSFESVEFQTMEDAVAYAHGWLESLGEVQDAGRRAYADFLTEYHGNSSVKFSNEAPTLQDQVRSGQVDLNQAEARARLAGIDDISRAYVFGDNRLQGKGQMARMMIRIFKGGDALTVGEEFSEGFIRRHFTGGTHTPREVAEMIREYEGHSERSYLPAAAEDLDDAQFEQAVTEAFSDLGTEYLAGNVETSWLPAKLKQWFSLLFDTVLKAAMDGARVMKRMQAEGKMNSELESLLAEAMGISDAAMRRQMEREMLDEAQDGVQSLADTARGLLPHPDTLEAEGHPLAGEIRSMYDAMRNDPDAGASQSVRTRKANEFFLPVGQKEDIDRVREYLGERGFEFETDVALVDALSDVILHGGTVLGVSGEPSFSISPREAVEIRNAINAQVPVQTTTAGIPTTLRAKEAVAWAKSHGVEGVTTHPEIGDIEIRPRGIKNAIGHMLTPRKAAVLLHIKSLISQSKLVHKWNRQAAPDSFRLAGRVDVDGVAYVARIIIDTDAHGVRYYNHELSDFQELQHLQPQKKGPQAVIPGVGQGQQIGVNELEDTGKLLRWIYSVNETRQQVGDRENGRGDARVFRRLDAVLRGGRSEASPSVAAEVRASAATVPDPVFGLTPNGQPVHVPLSATPHAGFGDPISAPEVITALKGVLKVVTSPAPIRVGHLRNPRKALGEYWVRSKVIRLATANDISTAAHEVAHAMEDAMFGMGHVWDKMAGLPPAALAELIALGKALYGTTKPNAGYSGEGFAEFFRMVVEGGHAHAAATAPEFAKWFDAQVLQKNPDLKKSIDSTIDAARRWNQQGALHRAKQSVAETPGRLKKLRSGFRAFIDAIPGRFVDMAFPLKEYVAQAQERSNHTVAPGEDPYLTLTARRLAHDAVTGYMVSDGMLDFAGNRVGKSLEEVLAPVRGRQDDFLIYLWARRALALSTDGKNRNAGLSLDDAAEIMKALDSPAFQLAAQGVYDWNNGVLEYAAQASPDYAAVVKLIRDADPGNYIPLFREFSAFDARYQKLKTGAKSGKLVDRLKGSGRRIKNPVESMIAQARALVLKSHQKRIIDQIVRIADTVPGMGDLVVEVRPDQVPAAVRETESLLKDLARTMKNNGASQEMNDAMTDAITKLGNESADVVEAMLTFWAPAQTPKPGEDPIVPIAVGGKRRWFEVSRTVYEAINGMEIYRLPKVLDLFLGVPTRTLRIGTTGLRASFSLVTNPLRDFRTLHLNSQSSANSATLFFEWIRQLGNGFLEAVSGGKFRSSWVDAFERMGGHMATPLGQDMQPTTRSARRLFEGRTMRIVDARNWLDFVRDVLQFPEKASRIVEMKTLAKDMGWNPSLPLTPEIAARLITAAKQVTTDFTAAGNVARVLNQALPFFNAGIQGPRAHIRAIKAHPVRFAVRGLMGTAMALGLWYRYRDDDWWKEMPESERYGFTYIPFDYDGRKELLRIPRSFEADGVFMAGAQALADAWYRQEPKRAGEWFGQWLSNFQPSLPPMGKDILEQAANKDFFTGAPIIPRAEMERPEEEQFSPYTTRVAIKLGEMAGISPRRIDHSIRSYFGGVGTDVAALFGRGQTGEGHERQAELADTTVIGTLFQRGGQASRSPRSIDALYDRLDMATKRQHSQKRKETPDEKKTRALLQDAARAVSYITGAARLEWSTDERRELDQLRVQVAKEAVDAFNANSKDLAKFKAWKKRAEALSNEAKNDAGNEDP